jgi:type IX secretion system PorP/SprF family membrane protein
MLRKKCLIVFCLLCATTLYSQDVHFSQYHQFPLMINPAYTGNYNGLFRASAMYRNQYFSIPNSNGGTYQTIGLYADGSVFSKRISPDRFNIGLNLYSDHAGEGSLTSQEALFSISYIKSTDRSNRSAIALGMQGGAVFKRVFVNDLLFESQIENFGFNPNLFNGETNIDGRTMIYPDFNIGVIWQQEASNFISYYVGGSVYHIGEPNETFYRDSLNFIPRRFNFHGGVDVNVNDEIVIAPSFLFMQQGSAMQLNAGCSFKYQFENNILGYFLVRYRGFSDAIILGMGAEKGSFRGSISYDFTTSNLSLANSGQGGVELSITYTYKHDRNTRRRRDQFCPSY